MLFFEMRGGKDNGIAYISNFGLFYKLALFFAIFQDMLQETKNIKKNI